MCVSGPRTAMTWCQKEVLKENMDLVCAVKVLACHCGSINTGCNWFHKFARFISCCCHGEGERSSAVIKQACCHKVVYTTWWCVSVCGYRHVDYRSWHLPPDSLSPLDSYQVQHVVVALFFQPSVTFPPWNSVALPSPWWPLTVFSTVNSVPLLRCIRCAGPFVGLQSTQPTSPPASCLCLTEAQGRLKDTSLNWCLAPYCVCMCLCCAHLSVSNVAVVSMSRLWCVDLWAWPLWIRLALCGALHAARLGHMLTVWHVSPALLSHWTHNAISIHTHTERATVTGALCPGCCCSCSVPVVAAESMVLL